MLLYYFLKYFLYYLIYNIRYSDIFPWSPEVALLLHPAGAFARPQTAALFGSYYFSILKVGISAFNINQSLTLCFLSNQSYPTQLQRKIRVAWQYQTRLKDMHETIKTSLEVHSSATAGARQ